MILSWSPIDGALVSVGSRRSAIETLWRGVPEDERTPVRRKLVIALVDHIREHQERTGHLAPTHEPDGYWVCSCGYGRDWDAEVGIGQREDAWRAHAGRERRLAKEKSEMEVGR